MTRRLFVIACCVLLSVGSMFAQSRGKAADPISGTWTGELVLENGFRHIPVTMTLKFDCVAPIEAARSATAVPERRRSVLSACDRNTRR